LAREAPKAGDTEGRPFEVVKPKSTATPLPGFSRADESQARRIKAGGRFLVLRDQVRWLYRALALRGGNETRILSRNQKDLGKKFPAIAESIAKLGVQDAIIDGEIVALDEQGRSSFQLLQGFDMGTERPPIIFYAFDLLQLNGKDLKTLPIEERKAKLAELLINPTGALRYSISFTKDIDELLGKAKDLGLEGLIGKRSGSRYKVGKRSGSWVKIKLHLEQEFVIGGYTDPDGARKHFGALLVGFYEGKKLKLAAESAPGSTRNFCAPYTLT
jgi:bifunctional non-homologous end joining protein LigD